jgi:ribosomal protein S21
MGRITVALSLDEENYKKYKRYCEEKGIILSRQVDKFIEEELKRVKRKSNNG